MKHLLIANLIISMLLTASTGFTAVNPSKGYDASLMISPATLMQKIKQKEDLFLVDIRHEKQFKTFKIPGSINIQLSFIKTKTFLKLKPIVLIHKSIAYSEMVRNIKELNNKGFNIKILQGGLAAWKHKGGHLAGNPFAQKELNKISARTFFMEKGYDDWVLIDASSKLSKNKIIKKALQAPLPEKIPGLIESIFLKSNNPLTGVIIFNQSGEDYSTLETKISQAYGHRIFYLQGGLEEYQKFLNFQMLANKPKSDRIKNSDHCEPCKKKDKK